MKTTAKVFIWIGMIYNFYLIFPIVFGCLALKKLKTATTRDELRTMAVLCLSFCNTVGGILMLTMTDKELSQGSQEHLEA